jgi:hypothetical protein
MDQNVKLSVKAADLKKWGMGYVQDVAHLGDTWNMLFNDDFLYCVWSLQLFDRKYFVIVQDS